MCRLAYLHFDADVTQERRRKVVKAVLTASWNLGNKHGAGLVTWTPGTEESPSVSRALHLKALAYPPLIGSEVLVHARQSTNMIDLAHTHPFEGGGAYLVHNGIVHVSSYGLEAKLKKKARTSNDSELILKAYLSFDRNLPSALTKLSGMANVMLWDERRGALCLYADTEDYQIWRQEGILLITQERAQSFAAIKAGLGNPYEFEALPKGHVIEVLLGEAYSGDQWVEAYRSAKDSSVEVKAAASSYTSYYQPTAYKGSYTAATDSHGSSYGYDPATGTFGVGGRVYNSDGDLLEDQSGKLTKAERKRLKWIEKQERKKTKKGG